MINRLEDFPLATDQWHCQRCGGELRNGKCSFCLNPDEELAGKFERLACRFVILALLFFALTAINLGVLVYMLTR